MSESEIRNKKSLEENQANDRLSETINAFESVIESADHCCNSCSFHTEGCVTCPYPFCVMDQTLFYLNDLNQRRKPIEGGRKYHVMIDKVCPDCGYMVNSKMNFCPTCGYDLGHNGYMDPIFEKCDCPLTLDQLEHMKGEPVFIILNSEDVEENRFWAVMKDTIIMSSGRRMIHLTDKLLAANEYGIAWNAYREEVRHE